MLWVVFLVALSLMAPVADAATIVRYVNTASTAGGDGTTNGTAGATRAYATLSEAETALRQTLTGVTNDVNDQDGGNNISLRIYVTGSSADTTAVTFSNASWVTDATHRIEVNLNGTTSGPKWDTALYRLSITSGYNTPAITISKAVHMDFVNLQAENTVTLDNAPKVLVLNDFASDVRIYGGFYRTTGTSGAADNPRAVWHHGTGAFTFRARNAVFATADGIPLEANGFSSTGSSALYNCLFVNRATNRRALDINNWGFGASNRVKNVAIQGTTGATTLYNPAASATEANILTQDASAPGTSLDNKTISFVDATNWDYHLASGDTSAKDAGTDLSADAFWPFSTDGDGATRYASWDIGADEYLIPTVTGCRLLQDGTSKRLLQNGTTGRILQGGGDCGLGGAPSAVPVRMLMGVGL